MRSDDVAAGAVRRADVAAGGAPSEGFVAGASGRGGRALTCLAPAT